MNAHGHGATPEGKQRCSITAAEAQPLGDEKGANTQTDTRRQAGDAIAPSMHHGVRRGTSSGGRHLGCRLTITGSRRGQRGSPTRRRRVRRDPNRRYLAWRFPLTCDQHGEASYRTPLTHLFQMGAQRKATRGVRDNIARGKSDATSGRRDGGWSQIECATRPLGGVDRLTRSREVALKRGHRQEWVTRLKVAGQPRSRGCERPRVCSWIVMIGRSRWAAWGPRISRRRRRAARGPSAIRIA